jgi:hypothetical protein
VNWKYPGGQNDPTPGRKKWFFCSFSFLTGWLFANTEVKNDLLFFVIFDCLLVAGRKKFVLVF